MISVLRTGTSCRHLFKRCTPALNSCIRGGCDGLPAMMTSFFDDVLWAKAVAASSKQPTVRQMERVFIVPSLLIQNNLTQRRKGSKDIAHDSTSSSLPLRLR